MIVDKYRTKERLLVVLRSSGTAFEEARIDGGLAMPNKKTGAAPSSCEKSSATQPAINAVLTLGSTSEVGHLFCVSV